MLDVFGDVSRLPSKTPVAVATPLPPVVEQAPPLIDVSVEGCVYKLSLATALALYEKLGFELTKQGCAV